MCGPAAGGDPAALVAAGAGGGACRGAGQAPAGAPGTKTRAGAKESVVGDAVAQKWPLK